MSKEFISKKKLYNSLNEQNNSVQILKVNQKNIIESMNHILERLKIIENKLNIDPKTDFINLTKPMASTRINDKKHLLLCPYHEDNSPTFMIDMEKHHYYCFGCGAEGEFDLEAVNATTNEIIKFKIKKD